MLQMELDSFPWNQQLKDKQVLVYSMKPTLLHGVETEQTNICYPRSFAALALEERTWISLLGTSTSTATLCNSGCDNLAYCIL